MKRLIMLTIVCLIFCGCASVQISTPKAVVLQKDMIYTLPAGRAVDLLLDNKPITVTFPEDMKVVSSDRILTQERALNDAILGKMNADKTRNKWIGIFGSALAALGGAFGVFLRLKNKGINLQGGIKA